MSIKAGDGGLLLAEKSIGDELGQKLNQISTSTSARQPPAPASAGSSSEEYANVHFDDGEDGEDGSPEVFRAAPPPEVLEEMKGSLEQAVARLPPESPEKKFATHLATQAVTAEQHQEWERAQSLYARALQKCGLQTPGGGSLLPVRTLSADLDDLVAGAVIEDADNPLFGDDEVDGLIERLEPGGGPISPRLAATPVFPKNDRQDREDLQSWYDLKELPWGKQIRELVGGHGWTEPSPEYDKIDLQLGRRVFVLEHGYGTLVKCLRKKRGWAPCAVDFVEGGKKTVILRLKGKEMVSLQAICRCL